MQICLMFLQTGDNLPVSPDIYPEYGEPYPYQPVDSLSPYFWLTEGLFSLFSLAFFAFMIWMLIHCYRNIRQICIRVPLLNRKLRGWANYFCLGPVSRAYRAVDEHARHRLRQWLRAKHKVRGRVEARYPDRYLHEELGLTQLALRTHNLPWANT